MSFKKLISILLIILAFTFSLSAVVRADETDGSSEDAEKVSDLEKKIEEYEEKLEKLQNRGTSLAQEIEYSNSQISLTELRIANSEKKLSEKESAILKLTDDIADLSVRIDKLVDSIKYQEKVLNERLRTRYKTHETSPLIAILGGDALNKVVQKSEYLKVMEVQDRKLLTQMNETKKAYGQQKNLFEDKKEEEEDLKKQIENEKANLVSYQTQLENQKAEKQQLLSVTQNDEAKYQEMLEDARRELNQILGAVSVLKDMDGEEVEKGDVIGIQGNSGRSTGPHLHFGVYRYSSFEQIDGWNWYYSNTVDPTKMLESKKVGWSSCTYPTASKTTGKGDWDWPIKGSVEVTNSYGDNCYKYSVNGGKMHPALDMVGPAGSPIYAVEDGVAYTCRNCLGDGGNGVFIFHPDNYMTLYWHLK